MYGEAVQATTARRVAAVIVHYGDSRPTIRAVLNHRRLGVFSDVVVVANDLSERPDELSGIACTWLIPTRNVGFGGACQLGAVSCSAEVYAFSNAHVTIDRDSLIHCVSAFDHDDVGIAAPCMYHPSEKGPALDWRYAGGMRTYSRILRLPINIPLGDRRTRDEVSGTELIDNDWATGGLIFCRDEVIKDIGWDGSYFLTCEDVDISIRTKKRGWRVVVAPAAVAFHSGESTRVPTASAYYGMRNVLWLARRYHARRIQVLLTAYLLVLLFRVAAADVLKRRPDPRIKFVTRGIRDGWLLWPESVEPLPDEPLWSSQRLIMKPIKRRIGYTGS